MTISANAAKSRSIGQRLWDAIAGGKRQETVTSPSVQPQQPKLSQNEWTDIISKQMPTGGEWTNAISWDEATETMTIKFNNGFTAVYPNVTRLMYEDALRGETTKDGRPYSVGAWLHKHPSVMRNYRGA